jgi:hypothetical protein
MRVEAMRRPGTSARRSRVSTPCTSSHVDHAPAREHGVEAGVGQLDGVHVGRPELRLREPERRRALARRDDHVLDEVDAEHLPVRPDEDRDLERRVADAAADVEHAVPAPMPTAAAMRSESGQVNDWKSGSQRRQPPATACHSSRTRSSAITSCLPPARRGETASTNAPPATRAAGAREADRAGPGRSDGASMIGDVRRRQTEERSRASRRATVVLDVPAGEPTSRDPDARL